MARTLAIESHLFDFAETITSGPMTVKFLSRLRDEQKFSGPEALREQILRDIATGQRAFAEALEAALQQVPLTTSYGPND